MENRENTIEVLDEVIYIAYTKMQKLKHNEFFNTWITRIAINECRDFIKKNSKITYISEYDESASIKNIDDMRLAAMKIKGYGCDSVLIKGGHTIGDATDLLYKDGKFSEFKADRIDTKNTHGTGCTLSSAIACNIANGLSIEESVKNAKDYVTNALKSNLSIGHGNGPINHCWNL